MVRYSNESLYGNMTDSPQVMLTNTQKIDGNQTAFGEIMMKTMKSMAVQTANNRSGMKFSAKTVNFSRSITLYGSEQCTPDLSATDCDRCLGIAIGKLSVMQGARILMPSCNVRYEIYPFYNGAVNYTATTNTNTTLSNENGEFNYPISLTLYILFNGVNNIYDFFFLFKKLCLVLKNSALFKLTKLTIICLNFYLISFFNYF